MNHHHNSLALWLARIAGKTTIRGLASVEPLRSVSPPAYGCEARRFAWGIRTCRNISLSGKESK